MRGGSVRQLHLARGVAILKPFDSLAEVSLPRIATHLAVGEDVQTDLLLHRQSVEDGVVLHLPQLLELHPTGVEFVARVKQPAWAQQTPDLVCAIGCARESHVMYESSLFLSWWLSRSHCRGF